MSPRSRVLLNFALRAAYGAVMIATPSRIGRPWVGEPADSASATVPLRGIGGREIALHLA